MAAVTYTRLPQMAGVECPLPGSATFQRTFFVSLHSTGGVEFGATPVARGPRHCGHWSATKTSEVAGFTAERWPEAARGAAASIPIPRAATSGIATS